MRGVMRDKGESRRRLRFAAVVLPWLLAVVMAAVYLLTLDHWVTPESLDLVANVSGLNPRVELFGPVTYLVTWPFRWLPLAWIPPALNLFGAACAVLSLAWLARSVALLPHDRTHAQRRRLRAGTPLLTLRSAWLPPTLAVLVCGLQLTFWEHAIAATGEMFNLFLFACLVRCLLELRADRNNARLLRFALVYGLAVANNWAMAAFAPLFFLAAVWAARANPFRLPLLEHALKQFKDRELSLFARIRQALQPFNLGMWVVSLGCFLAGLCLLMLLPLVASSADNAPMHFWTNLHSTLHFYKRSLLAVPISTVLLLCLGSVLPALLMTIRWGRRTGRGRVAGKLVAGIFHGLHAFLLIVSLWAALDLPLSPRRLGVGFPFLPLYYLGALSVGYFSGYFLLVFGTRPRKTRHRTRPLRVVNVALTAAVWLALVGVPALMLHKSLPYILWSRTGALENYATQIERCLPPPGAVILGDHSFRLLCLQTTLIRHGQQNAYLLVDGSSLIQDPGYFDILRHRHPDFNLALPLLHQSSDLTNPPVLTSWLKNLVAAHEVYSLHSFAGYLGESFSFQPRGLFYQFKPSAASVLEEGRLPPEVLAENQAFWQAFIAKPMPELIRHIPSPEQYAHQPRSLQSLHQKVYREPERDPWAAVVGAIYSRALDTWGVELQKAGLPREAGNCFGAALQLNPNNRAAQINRDFNQDLQAHKPAAIQTAQQIEAQLGNRRSWSQILAIDGSLDDPNACYKIGTLFAEANLPRQAAQQFNRAQTLAPGLPDVALRLAEQLVRLADSTNALAAANQAMQLKPLDPDALYWKGCSLILLKDYEDAIPVLNQLLTIQTNSRTAMSLGFANIQLGNLDAARQAYERAAQFPTNAYQAYFRLAQVAYRQKDTNAAIKYIELYRSNTPPNLLDNRLVDAIFAELRGTTIGADKP